MNGQSVTGRGVAVPLSKAHDRHWALCGELISTCIPPCRHDLRHKKIRFYATNVKTPFPESIISDCWSISFLRTCAAGRLLPLYYDYNFHRLNDSLWWGESLLTGSKIFELSEFDCLSVSSRYLTDLFDTTVKYRRSELPPKDIHHPHRDSQLLRLDQSVCECHDLRCS